MKLRVLSRALVFSVALSSCSANPTAKPTVQPEAARPIPATSPTDGAEFTLPAGQSWLIDEDGREYFVREIAKVEGGYVRPKPGVVRIGRGETYELEGEDETTFRVKIFRVTKVAGPSPEEIAGAAAAVAASYRGEAGVSDQWRLVDFGRGLPQRGQWRQGFVIVDFDGDGHLDLVHGPVRKGTKFPTVFFGDGTGGFRGQTLQVARAEGYDYGDVAVADFNRDGRLDLALGVHLHGLVVLVAGADGRFEEWSRGIEYGVPGASSGAPGFSSRAVAAADWNGDGWTDLLALGEGPRLAGPQIGAAAAAASNGLAIFENLGDGSWRAHLEPMARAHGGHLEVADLDADGRLDAILGSSVLGAKKLLRYGAGGSAARAEEIAARPRSYSQAVRLADLDRDSRVDLLVGYVGMEGIWRHGVDAFYARETGFERRTLYVAEGRQALTALAAGDVDGDSRVDVVALTSEGETLLFRGNEKGFFDREHSPDLPGMAGCRGYHVELADLDGDGGDEVIAEFAGEPSPLLGESKCPTQGAIRAWKAARVTR